MTDLNPVTTILEIAGYRSVENMPVGETVKINGGAALMPLVIKKATSDQLMVAHYHEQQGEKLYDPAVWFAPVHAAESANLNEWSPIQYRQDPTLEQRNPNGIDLDGFLSTWMSNIRSQGYVDKARKKYGSEGNDDAE